jgi:hypothetical protein
MQGPVVALAGAQLVGRVEGPLSLWLGVAKGTFKRVGALGGGLASGRFHCLARYDICSPVQTPWRMGRRETRVGEETPIVSESRVREIL